jgi:hypothetical protein
MNPLLESVLIGSCEEVSMGLTKYFINDQDNLLGQSVLHLAVMRPQHFKAILNAKPNLDARDRHGITPLMYAAAMGETDIVLRLLQAGASPEIRDLLWQRNFLGFANVRGHWNTIMTVLDSLKSFESFPKDVLRAWLTYGLWLWTIDNEFSVPPDGWYDPGMSNFSCLLEWGADPNQTELKDQTILHHVKDALDAHALVSHGFTKFNHQDSTGVHTLIAAAEKMNPDLLRICLEKGSLIDHQDHRGRTALYCIAEHILNSHTDDRSSRAVDCMKTLLDCGSDPLVGDYCRCACSTSGCTFSHMLLNRISTKVLRHKKDIWSLEWLQAVQNSQGLKVARMCALDMLRLLYFEELELTHTCCRNAGYVFAGDVLTRMIEKDEIDEIIDEEEELIQNLEITMREIEGSLGPNIEDVLIHALARRAKGMKEDAIRQNNKYNAIVSITSRNKVKPDFYIAEKISADRAIRNSVQTRRI